VSRLDFAPKIDDIKVTDIKRGLGAFTPKPDKPVSFAALKAALKRAGYALASAEITGTGKPVREGSDLWLVVGSSKQRFAIEGSSYDRFFEDKETDSRIEVTGDWRTSGAGPDAREVIRPSSIKKLVAAPSKNDEKLDELSAIQVSLAGTGGETVMPLAPVRTTSPGLTVYRGGAITPRYSYTRQHLGGLKVDRHSLLLGVSYTPTPTLQFEAEIPYQSTQFDNGTQSGSGNGLGNITLWGKYRFYRALETWGDKQSALRFGLELPTGKKGAPGEAGLDASEFVRQQLGGINGGLAVHADAAYSQARRRLIYGANMEGIFRNERDGFRLGHELRLNTDLEYVLLPFKYRSPTKELFLILETTTALRGRGRARGQTAPGSSSSEFYLAPALQYVASPRLVIEASLQLPVARSAGPQALRTDKNLLVGVRYLY
jgi:hypothetical protein